MKNEQKLKQKEDAKRERFITPNEMIEELLPLLKEYFVANFRISDNHIIMRFLNGQQIIITVS